MASWKERSEVGARDNAAMKDTLSHLQGHLNAAGDELAATTLAHSRTQDELRRVAAALAVKEVRAWQLRYSAVLRCILSGCGGVLVSGVVWVSLA